MILLISMLVVMLLITLYGYNLLKKYVIVLPFFALFLFEIIWDILSLVCIENGVYILEQNIMSYFTGALFKFLFVISPIVILTPIFMKKTIEDVQDQYRVNIISLLKLKSNTIVYFILGVFICMSLYINIDILISGSPLVNNNITRFNFYTEYSRLPLAAIISNVLSNYIVLVSGVIFSDKNTLKIQKYLSIFIFILVIIQRLLLGNKFAGIIFVVYYYILGVSVIKLKEQIDLKKTIKSIVLFGTIIVVLFGTISYIHYSKVYDNPLKMIFDRVFSLQAHTFWGVDRLDLNGININQVIKEVTYGFKEASIFSNEVGLGRIMTLISPDIASVYLRDGVLFTGGYFTVGAACLGYMCTFIYSFLVVWMISMISKYMYIAIKNNQYILLFFIYLIFNSLYDYFRIGNLSLLLNYKIIISCIVIILYEVIFVKRFKRERAS